MKPENKFRKDELNKVAGGVNEPPPTEEKDPLKLEVETQKTVAPEDLPKVAGGAGEPTPTEEKDPLKLEVETQKIVAPEDLPKVAGGAGDTKPEQEINPITFANTTKENVTNLPSKKGTVVTKNDLSTIAYDKGPINRVQNKIKLEK